MAMRAQQRGYEKSLLEELLMQHLHGWREYDQQSHANAHALSADLARRAREFFPNAVEILTSVEYRSPDGCRFHRGDLAIINARERPLQCGLL